MFQIEELDAYALSAHQLRDESQEPAVLSNVFLVQPDDVDVFIAGWTDLIRRFKGQNGFISAQLYRGTLGS